MSSNLTFANNRIATLSDAPTSRPFVRSIRPELDRLAAQDLNETLLSSVEQELNQAIDENNESTRDNSYHLQDMISIPISTPPTPVPTPPVTPLQQLSSIIQLFRYGDMMQLARELKNVPGASFDTPEGVAAFLHGWAVNYGKPQANPAESTAAAAESKTTTAIGDGSSDSTGPVNTTALPEPPSPT